MYAQWRQGPEGEHIYTLFVSIDVLEHKVKPRKGLHMGWCSELAEVSLLLASQPTEDIHAVDLEYTHWTKIAGRLPNLKTLNPSSPESHNRFATLLANEAGLEQ